MNEINRLDMLSDIGYLLLKHGAEIYRVEESMNRMIKSYGYEDVEVFAIPTFLTVSVKLNNQQLYTRHKRTLENRIHLDNVFELNNLVRKICNHELTDAQIKEEIEKIENSHMNFKLIFIGYIVSAGAFAGFFGGGIKDVLVASLIGFVMYYVILFMENYHIQSIIRTIITSIILGVLCIFFQKIGFLQTSQYAITGCIMLLVPGIAITNSLRDIIGGDYISGLSRMAEAILIAASIAIGVGSMMLYLGGC